MAVVYGIILSAVHKCKSFYTGQKIRHRGQFCVTFLLRLPAEVINTLICNSQNEAVMNRLPVMMMPIGQKEFNMKA